MLYQIRLSAAILAALLALASGCRTKQEPNSDGEYVTLPSGAVVAKMPATQPIAIHAEIAPATDGPGLGICDPLSTSPGLNDFGAGCARYVQYLLGEHVELGQNPGLSEQRRALLEMKQDNARFTVAQAMRYGACAGYTHVAVGKISGVASNTTLTYRIYSVPDALPVGKEVTVAGNEDQLGAQLPELTNLLLSRLKVSAAPAKAPTPATGAELNLLGRYPWRSYEKVEAGLQAAIDSMAERQPAAGLLSLLQRAPRDKNELTKLAARRFAQAPGNLEMCGAIAYQWAGLQPEFVKQFLAGLPTGHNNAIVMRCRIITATAPNDHSAATERFAAAAPRSPSAWMYVATWYGSYSEHIRRSRTADKISGPEWALLNQIYVAWESAAKKAVKADPLFSDAWAELAVSATFIGHESIADNAVWQAINLDPANPKGYRWALEMYQPKWFSDQTKLQHAASMACLAPFTQYNASSVSRELKWEGMDQEAITVMNRALNSGAGTGHEPEDPYTRITNRCIYMMTAFRWHEAIAAANQATNLHPKEANAYSLLGKAYEGAGDHLQAVKAQQTCVKLTAVFNANAHGSLGLYLMSAGQADEAITEFRSVLQVQPDCYRAVVSLGFALFLKRDYPASLKQYENAAKLRPEAPEPHYRQCGLYNMMEKYDLAQAEGEKAIELGPDEPLAHEIIGVTYLGLGRFSEAGAEEQIAVRTSRSAYAHLQLAKALLKLGKRDEAKRELNIVISMKPGTSTLEEAKRLLSD